MSSLPVLINFLLLNYANIWQKLYLIDSSHAERLQLATEIVGQKYFNNFGSFAFPCSLFLLSFFILFNFFVFAAHPVYFFMPACPQTVEKCFAMQIFVNQAETELRATSWSQ